MGRGPCPVARLWPHSRRCGRGLFRGMELCWLHSWESMHGSLLRCIMEYNIWPELEQVRDRDIPLFFIHGECDTIAPIERVRLAAQSATGRCSICRCGALARDDPCAGAEPGAAGALGAPRGAALSLNVRP